MAAAAESYRRSLAVDPTYLPALYNLGLVLHEAGALEEAESCFRRLLAAQPGDAEALFHLGALQQRGGRLAEAADTFRAALRLSPDDAQLWMRLGEVRLSQAVPEALEEAAACYTRGATLAPDAFEAHFNRGSACVLLGRHAEAVEAFSRALALRPDHPAVLASLLFQMQQVCDWSRFGELSDALRRRAGASLAAEDPHPEPFVLLGIASTLSEQLASARAYAGAIEARVAQGQSGRHRRAVPSRQSEPVADRSRRLRIGYLSSDFREHVTAHVMAEVFELHDRRRFACIAYSCGPDDGSPMRHRLEHAFERFVDLRRASDAQAAGAIAADGIDILVDLKGYTRDARSGIAALRPAPVQASFLGYPATMGAEFIDYIITDRFVLPPASATFYTERPAYLPGCYYPGDRGRPRAAPPPRRDLGLPQDAFVFCCFNQSFKILPEVFAAWMRMLRQLPGAVLWLLESNRWANENLIKEAVRQGGDPRRLVFAARTAPNEYLRRLAAADLFLDTTPYNAHTTANDALWVGLPVLTCAGDTLPSRVAGSQLQAIGLPELVTRSLAEYEALGLRLARAPAELTALREKLRRNRETAPLFDMPRYVHHLESAFDAMWRAYTSDGICRPIEV